MKLNHNCVRDILIICEDHPTFNEYLAYNHLYLNNFCDKLPSYSNQEIVYTLILLEEAGLIIAKPFRFDGGISDICVTRLTYAGHEFIDTIRSDNVWEKVNKTISSVSSISLPILQQIGSQILLSLLSAQ